LFPAFTSSSTQGRKPRSRRIADHGARLGPASAVQCILEDGTRPDHFSFKVSSSRSFPSMSAGAHPLYGQNMRRRAIGKNRGRWSAAVQNKTAMGRSAEKMLANDACPSSHHAMSRAAARAQRSPAFSWCGYAPTLPAQGLHRRGAASDALPPRRLPVRDPRLVEGAWSVLSAFAGSAAECGVSSITALPEPGAVGPTVPL